MEKSLVFFYLMVVSSYIENGVNGQIIGFRVESSSGVDFVEDLIPEFQEGSHIELRFFGNFVKGDEIGLTDHISTCNFLMKDDFPITVESPEIAKVSLELPILSEHRTSVYFCLKRGSNWTHQGTAQWLKLFVRHPLVPMWINMVVMVFAILLSSLFNGLALGLLSLNVTDLKVIANAGEKNEKKYAKTILPVRQMGNYLLCSILLGSTAFNSVFTVILDEYLSNWITIVTSTLIIVIGCEVMPCSVVPRFGLMMGAKTIWLTRMIMIITAPVSYPLGKFLDTILGEEVTMYTKEKFKELLKLTSEYSHVKNDEIAIISGALEMNTKKVEDVMTPLEDVYMLPITSYLDFETVAGIMKSGYSRIPIYEGEKSNVVALIFTRDLALLDPDDKTQIRLLVEIYNHEVVHMTADTTLDVAFNMFKEGRRGHLAFVTTLKDGEKRPEVIGLVTLEDVIEELIQAEIIDEFDCIVDNRSKRKRERAKMASDFLTVFAEKFESRTVYISPQLRIAAFQYLEFEVEAFHKEKVSPNVLRRLLYQGVIYHVTSKKKMKPDKPIITTGEAAQSFVMVLEGRVEVHLSGPEKLKFESGPFTCFGLCALTSSTDLTEKYDYTVTALGEVRFLKISNELYLAARRATQYEYSSKVPDLTKEPFPALFTDSDSERGQKEDSSDMLRTNKDSDITLASRL
ncbi:unextended protein isoform X1 [Halyomorpha halys]|uniref:unextended protein isoform X1 n=1 Tax=Halyomorpha halys TaxID=286706 RepID=UPI0006D4D592|nr:metal transporter CNNM4-like isoform X1 [Halyomorpha halys]